MEITIDYSKSYRPITRHQTVFHAVAKYTHIFSFFTAMDYRIPSHFKTATQSPQTKSIFNQEYVNAVDRVGTEPVKLPLLTNVSLSFATPNGSKLNIQ